MDKIAALLGVESVCGLPRTLIDRLAAPSGMQRIGKGSILFRQGERAHFVYVLIEGSVSLLSGTEEDQTIADFIDAGEIILIAPALLQLPYMLTAKAVSDLMVVMIPAAEFRQIAETELPLSVALNRILARQWRHLLKHLTQTKSRDADSRLIQFLVDSAATRKGSARFSLPGSKQDLAAHLGITPATLSRSLKRLGRLGVQTKGSEVRIEEVSRLNIVHSEDPAPRGTSSGRSE